MLRGARCGDECGSPHFSKPCNVVVECSRVPPLPPPAELTIITIINQHQSTTIADAKTALNLTPSHDRRSVSRRKAKFFRLPSTGRVTLARDLSLNDIDVGPTTW